MSLSDELWKMNSLAHQALKIGDSNRAYRLKMKAAQKALTLYKIHRDPVWVKLSRKLLVDAKEIKNQVSKTVLLSETNSVENKTGLTNQSTDSSLTFLVKPEKRLSDIAGLEKTKQEFREAVEWPLKYNDLMEEYGLDYVLKGILLYGPPGCGKSLLVEAVAKDLNMKLYSANPANIMVKWVGESEKRMKRLFEEARRNTPSIIFVDEADKIFPKQTDSSVTPRIISVYLQEVDGVGSHNFLRMIVVLASNEPWNISTAIIRMGRVDRIIYVPPPDFEARIQLFKIYGKSRKLGDDVDFRRLAELTGPHDGWCYSGSDIANICRNVKKMSIRKAISEGKHGMITMNHFMEAMKTTPPSISPKMLQKYEDWAKRHASYMDS